MKKIEMPESDKIELKKWDALLQTSHEFHSFDWLKFEIDMDTYLTYTNSVFPISLLNVKESWMVLDIGCGVGRDVNILKRMYGANAIGIDIQSYNDDMILADGRSLCFKDNSFDAIISILALPYVYDEKGVLKEIKRTLKPNGKVILTLVNNSLSNFGYTIRKIFFSYNEIFHSPKKIKHMLESLDFEIEVIHFANFSFPLLNRLPKFYKMLFRYENKLSKMWIARWIAKRIVVIAKAE